MARVDLIVRTAAAAVFLAALAGPATPLAAAGSAVETAPSGGSRQRAAELDVLFAALKNAPNEAAARAIEDTIWRRWMQAPDQRIEALLQDAMARRGVYDFAGARTLLDEAVAGAPNYAEVYNQRGYVLFLQEDFDGALADVDRAIEIEPRHFAAMAGRALILMRQGRHQLAQAQLRRAVEIHPFLKERSLLVGEPGKPPRPGVDL